MALSNGTRSRERTLNAFFSQGWQAENTAGTEIIETPEKHLLTADQLFSAEGGNAGLALQVLGVGIGIGTIFASSTRMTTMFRHGAFTWREWMMLGGASFASNHIATTASIHMLGDANAYNNHWSAYSYVRACNRWEGR
tara:strand:- start:140 stop:556 length:417 start_codon:yes stop_codon:yes gene_type:complete